MKFCLLSPIYHDTYIVSMLFRETLPMLEVGYDRGWLVVSRTRDFTSAALRPRHHTLRWTSKGSSTLSLGREQKKLHLGCVSRIGDPKIPLKIDEFKITLVDEITKITSKFEYLVDPILRHSQFFAMITGSGGFLRWIFGFEKFGMQLFPSQDAIVIRITDIFRGPKTILSSYRKVLHFLGGLFLLSFRCWS